MLKLFHPFLIIISFCFFFSNEYCFGQEEKKDISDFNKDKKKDTLITYYDEHGEAWRMQLKSGNQMDEWEFYPYYWPGNFCAVLPFSKDLYAKGFGGVVPKVEEVFGIGKRFSKPDASLQWLMNVSQNRFYCGDDFYMNKWSWDPVWLDTFPKPPVDPYHLMLDSNEFKKIFPFTLQDFRQIDSNSIALALVHYSSHCQYSLLSNEIKINTEQVQGNRTLYSTAHGLFVKVGEKYNWCWGGDNYFTIAPHKLRWASVDTAFFAGDLIVLKCLGDDFEKALVIIDYENGVAGKVHWDSLDFDPQLHKVFVTLKGDYLEIGNSPAKKQYRISDLRAWLRENKNCKDVFWEE